MREHETSADDSDASSDAESSKRVRGTPERRALRTRSQPQSPGLLARPVSIAVPATGKQAILIVSAGSVGNRGEDDVDSGTH